MSGYLLDGQWHEGWYDTAATAVEFKRIQAIFSSMVIEGAKKIYLAESVSIVEPFVVKVFYVSEFKLPALNQSL